MWRNKGPEEKSTSSRAAEALKVFAYKYSNNASQLVLFLIVDCLFASTNVELV
jgi:predicted glycosyltransferase involved in capsule biosynthesis